MLRIIVLLALATQIRACVPRKTNDGIICVCNATFCDTIPEIGDLSNTLKVFYTSATEAGFNVKETTFAVAKDPAASVISIQKEQFQKIIGFGGAFTDSSTSVIVGLSDDLRRRVLESYFGDNGIEYNICRINLGACDFSPRLYTLDDSEQPDPELKNFTLQPEDTDYKIPTIQQALSLRGKKQLNLFVSAWTAPLWMKTKKVWRGGSLLKPEYYQSWAEYHLKYLEQYLENGIKIWGLTVGNEPLTGLFSDTPIPSMGWDTAGQAKYIRKNLGPTIRNSTNHKDLKIMILDESLNVLPFMVTPMFEDDDVLQYVDGVAIHWYQDSSMDPDVRLLAFTDKKDVFVIESETCHFITKPILGTWARAADYLDSIITNLQYNVAGWVEWNLALNTDGGPVQTTWPADAPIIISDDRKEFYKQPMFYALGHFSKFIVPDSVRLNTTQDTAAVRTVAFLRPDGLKAVVVYNSGTKNTSLQIEDEGRYSATLNLPPQSVSTVLYPSS